MPDVIDLAAEIQAEHLARGIAASRVPIVAGVAGECGDCGEFMERLVGGRCGYCRDGRRPPLSRFDDTPNLPPVETIIMANPPPTPDRRQISLPATGPVLRAIEQLAAEHDMALGQAAIALVERGMSDRPTENLTPLQRAWFARGGSLDELFASLLVELDEARTRPDRDAEVAALTKRAEQAEAKVARMREAMA